MPTARLASDDEILTCLAAGLINQAIGARFGRSRGWAAGEITRLYRRFNIPGKGSVMRVFVAAVRAGLPPPGEDETAKELVVLRLALEAVVSGRVVISASDLMIFQCLVDGLSPEEIGRQPDLFDEDTPLTAGAIGARCFKYAGRLNVKGTDQVVLVLLWAELLKLPPAFKADLAPREITQLRLTIEGLTRELVASECGIAESTVQHARTAICSKLGVAEFSLAIMVAVSEGLIEMPEWLSELAAQAAADPPPDEATAGLVQYLKDYPNHDFAAHPEHAKGSATPMGRLLRHLHVEVPFSAVAVMTKAGLITSADFVKSPAAPKLQMPSLWLTPGQRPPVTLTLEFPGPVVVTITGPEGQQAIVTVGDLERMVTLGAAEMAVTTVIQAASVETVQAPDVSEEEPVGDVERAEEIPLRDEEEAEAEELSAVAETESVLAEPAPTPAPVPTAEELLFAAIEGAAVDFEAKFVLDEDLELLMERHAAELIRAARNGQLRASKALEGHLAYLRERGLPLAVRPIVQAYADGLSGGRIDRDYARGGKSAKAQISALMWGFKARRYQTVVLFAIWAGLVERHPDN